MNDQTCASLYFPSRYTRERRARVRYDRASLKLGVLGLVAVIFLYSGALHDFLSSIPSPLALLYGKLFLVSVLSLLYVLYKRD